MKFSSIIGITFAAAAMGCIEPKSSDGGDDTSDTDSATGVTIYDLQQGNVEPDTQVVLRDVLISSPLTAYGEGFYIQEPDGGPYSGMYVFLQGTFTDLYITMGDEVTITGQYTEYYELSELTVTSADAIEVTGTGTVLAEPVADVTDWEPYEGVVVELSNQEAQECIDSYGEVMLSEGIQMDDAIYTYDTELGATYSTITGPITYNYKLWKILPRMAEDLQGYTAGEGCNYTCAQIQQDGVTGGVELNGVVVTSGLTSDDKGFFVQDEGGGDYSGMYIYLAWKDPSVSYDIGDKLDIVGSATEYYDFTEVGVGSADDLTASGSGTPVATSITSTPSDWEMYESMLVTLTDVEITAAADYGEMETNYGINLDDLLYSYDLTAGSTYDTITGLISYSYGAYKLLPRDEADLTGGIVLPPETVTVSEIQQGTAAGKVILEGVIATTDLTSSGGAFFVQDAGGGTYSGVYVYLKGDAYGAVDISEGDELTITGEVTEYYDFTELSVDDPADVVVTGTGTPAATNLSSVPSDWEPYEGVLVKLSGIGLDGSDDGHGGTPTDWTSLSMGTMFYDWTGSYSSGDDFTSVTGPISYTWSAFRVEPRAAGDIVE